MARAAGLAGIVLCLGVLACRVPAAPRTPLGTTETTVEPQGFSLAPADVLVAPVRDMSGAFDSVRAPLRQALYTGLVARLFSPLRLEHVDGRIESGRAEPTLDGSDEILLRTSVYRWDTGALESNGVVETEVEVELVRPLDGAPTVLWRTFLSRRLTVEMPTVRRSSRGELVRVLADRLGAEILLELPPRGSVAPPPAAEPTRGIAPQSSPATQPTDGPAPAGSAPAPGATPPASVAPRPVPPARLQ